MRTYRQAARLDALRARLRGLERKGTRGVYVGSTDGAQH
jgi:hypothetical protein